MGTRRERVILDLEDHFTPGIVRAAGATKLLNHELDSLSRDAVRTRRSVSDIDQPVQNLGRSSTSTSKEVDKLSGRMRIFADLAATLGPALIPLGAVGVPAVAGMAAQLGFAATAGATAILAFQGVGDAVKALNAAALMPTQANLEKAQIALENLSPAAQHFVARLGEMIPELRKLRDVAAEGMFPGLTVGLDELEAAAPKVQGLVAAVSSELGSIAADAGASLASDKWTSFLDFLAREAPSALGEMAQAAGHTAHAVAAIWMATEPLNQDFSSWLVKATADVDRWATGLAKTQGFADFLAYVDSTGPKAAGALGAIANAAVQIVQAASPLGGPVLDGIKVLGDVVGAIADSDLGTPLFTAAAALALFNRTLGLTRSLSKTTYGGMVVDELRASAGVKTLIADMRALNREGNLSRIQTPAKGFIGPLTEAQTAVTRLRSSLPALAKTTALVAGLGVASTGAADKIGLTNTASLALMGTFISPGWGTAIGGAAGLLIDAGKAGDGLTESMHRADAALRSFDTSAIETALAKLEQQRYDLTHHTSVGDFFGDRVSELRTAGLFSSAVDNVDAKIAKLKGHLEFTREQAQQRFLADGFHATATGIDAASSSAQDFQTQLLSLNDTLQGRASFRDYEQALLDFTNRQKKRAKVLTEIQTENANYAASVANSDRDLAAAKAAKGDQSGRIADIQAQRAQEAQAHQQRLKDLQTEGDALKNSLNTSTQAGIDTTNLLDRIASTALQMAQKLDPVKRAEFLAGARRDFLKAADAAGMAKDAAQKLADKVLGLSAIKGEVKIEVDADGAWHVIDLTARKLERLTRPTRKINIEAQAAVMLPQVMDVHQGKADGGTIPGQRWPYGDKVLIAAAPGRRGHHEPAR